MSYLSGYRYTCQFGNDFSPEYDSTELERIAVQFKLENVPTGVMIKNHSANWQEFWVTCYNHPFSNFAIYERIINRTRPKTNNS